MPAQPTTKVPPASLPLVRSTLARKRSRRGSFALAPEGVAATPPPALAPLIGKRVRIVGVHSLPQLNGQSGVAVGEADGRVRVVLDAAHHGGRNITLPLENLAVEAPLLGKRVRVVGLKGKAELNGRVGVADSYNALKQRYHVVLDGDASAPVMLKPENVVVVEQTKPKVVEDAAGPPAASAPRKEVASSSSTHHHHHKSRGKGAHKDGWRERARKRRRASAARKDTAKGFNLPAEQMAKIEEEAKEAADELAAARRRQKFKKAAKKAALLALAVGDGDEKKHHKAKKRGRGKKKRGGKGGKKKKGARRNTHRPRRESQERLLSMMEAAKLRAMQQGLDAVTEVVPDGSGDSVIRSPGQARYEASVRASREAATAASTSRARRRSSVSGPIVLRPSLLGEGPAPSTTSKPQRRRSSVAGLPSLRPGSGIASSLLLQQQAPSSRAAAASRRRMSLG